MGYTQLKTRVKGCSWVWKETDRVKQRREFVEMYLKDRHSMTTLCRLFGVSRKTGYKTIARFKEEGWEGLIERSHAAHEHPNATDERIAERLIAAKHERPRWGPEKLLDWLWTKHPEQNWPAVSTAGGILKRAGLVRANRRRRPITHPGRPRIGPVTAPNQVHNIDFKGHFRTRDGRWCYPLTLTDTFSRSLLLCQGFLSPTSEDTQAALKLYFREHGLPDAIRSDNGEPFVSPRTLAGLSRLGVWLIKLGVERIRTRPGSPQDNGLHERMHRTLKEETAIPPAGNLTAQQRRFNQFRRDYNQERPHSALDGRTPASCYLPSPRQMPERTPTIEYEGHLMVRSVRTDGTIKWKGHHLFVSEVLEGERVGLEEIEYGVWSVFFGSTLLGTLDENEGRIFG
jgi:putative transposase